MTAVVDIVCGLDATHKRNFTQQWRQAHTDAHTASSSDSEGWVLDAIDGPICPCCTGHHDVLEVLANSGHTHVLLATPDDFDVARFEQLLEHRAKQRDVPDLVAGHTTCLVNASLWDAVLPTIDRAADAAHGGKSNTRVEAMIRQVEAADAVVVHGDDDALRGLLSQINPIPGHPEGLPGWLQRMVEDIENDALAGVYRARRPFHPVRFRDVMHHHLGGLVRGHGFVWLAHDLDQVFAWSVAGRCTNLWGSGRWWATRNPMYWPATGVARQRLDARWQEPWGDRRQEIVLIGPASQTLQARLDACLLTDAEMAAGEVVWRTYDEPLASEGWAFQRPLLVAD